MRARFLLLFILTCLSATQGSTAVRSAERLPSLHLDPAGTTVSGLSSGAFMAVQLHIAYSKRIIGVGVVAGGPYYCAEGLLSAALFHCMKTTGGAPKAGALLARARELARDGRIDPLEDLSDDRVYLFSGTQDSIVARPVMDAARDFYRQAGVAGQNIKYVNNVPAGHAFIVEHASNSCGTTGSPFINDCDYDQAGAILRHLYGSLAPPGVMDERRLLEFDQAEFVASPEAHGMASRGFVYIPAACAAGETCRLHIAFAGCDQTPAQIGNLYARTTGYNRWAETNRLVVLYPQTAASIGNPNGCWDWWGYDDPEYFTKRGRQMIAIARMATRLGVSFGAEPDARFCRAYTDLNWNHWLKNRATVCGWSLVCAAGSGDALGSVYVSSTVYESPEGTYSTTRCSP
jgi:poly(3-hydroxybutyrate) depolymerase